MQDLIFIVFSILVVWNCHLNLRLSPIQITTLWLSKRLIQNPEIKELLKTGKISNNNLKKARSPQAFYEPVNAVQNLITPQTQNIRQSIFPIAIIALIISGLFIHWYLSILSSIIVYFLPIVLFRSKLCNYIAIVETALKRRQTKLREQSVRDHFFFLDGVIGLIHEEYLFAKDNNLKLYSKSL